MIACSVEKNTGTTRFYHSLTAHYNIYFNAFESYKAGFAKITNGYRDDYAEVLNVYEFSDPTAIQAAASDMENAIQKASKLISLKSITAKPSIDNRRDISERDRKLLDRKEYNEWVDDSYLLIGKSRFLKHEFSEAESVFKFCIAEANDPNIRTEASIWLAMVYSEEGNFNEASATLKQLEITDNKSKTLRAMFNTAFADMFIKQKRYADAIEPLTKGLEFIKGKRSKYRLTYLLAQLHENSGSNLMASELYRKVIKMNPPYEVEFNARINIAGSFDVSKGDPGEISKELERMLKDPKNKEFEDQIYYALGNLSMREGKDPEALEYFRKSASAATSNQNQKGRSYLSLADYYFNRSDFIEAGIYLDSAVFFLDKSYPGYSGIKTKSQNLNDLVTHLIVIEREDSLQRVAAMPASQRNEIISRIIVNVNNQDQSASNDNADRYNIGEYYENERRFQDNIDQEGKWYFYNQAALTFGRTEFKKRWGERKLENNWRRANKARTTTQDQVLTDENQQDKQAVKDSASAVTDNKSPEFYLKNLPLTDSLLNISNDKHANAMLNAAKAYEEKINDTVKAIETLESLLMRHPSSILVPEALYDLYRLAESRNKLKSETYRQRLIENYPDTEFAKILSDPDYYRNKKEALVVTEKLYEEAYETYKSEQFERSIQQINDALALYPENPLAPKFMLLHAYAVARLTDERTFKEDLGILISTYPETPESTKAKELIGHINEEVPELKIEEEKIIAAEIYVADTTDTRTFVIVIKDPKFNINQATFDVISYNIDYYTNKNYRTEGALVENKYLQITVSGFRSFKAAIEYYQKFKSASPIRNGAGAEIITFIISPANLQKLSSDKNPDRYEIFFRENFLK